MQRAHRRNTRGVTASPLGRWLRIGVLLFTAQALALGLQAILLVQKERDLLVGITVSRLGIATSEVQAQFKRAAANGLLLTDSGGLARLLPQLAADDPEIEAIQVFDHAAKVVYAVGAPLPELPPELAAKIMRANGNWFAAGEGADFGRLQVGRALIDDAGLEAAGGVLISVRATALAAPIVAAQAAMLPRLALTLAGVAAALVPLLWLAANVQRWLTLRGRLLVAALLLAAVSSLGLTFQTLPSFTDRIAPALNAKAERVASFLAGRVSHALALGIPFEHLNGMQAYFDETLDRHPEIVTLSLGFKGADGGYKSRYESRSRGTPGDAADSVEKDVVGPGGHAVAHLRAGIDRGVAVRELRALAADLGIVFLVAVIVFNEALRAILAGDNRSVIVGGGGRERLGMARLAVFLLILAEELTRAFLPLHIASLERSGALTESTAIGLPISAYMASFALLTPFAGRWAARFGAARIFALGAALSAAGFAWALLSVSYGAFIAARCLCAAGYAIGTMAMQHHFLRSGDSERARSLALLVGAVQTAAICGAPIGGLLADRFGSGAVFAGAAGLSLLALAVQRLDRRGGRGPSVAPAAPRLSQLLRRRRVLVALVGAALPIKLVLAGFLFYLLPIALQQEGYTSSSTGRAMMLYFLLVAASNPLGSWLSDRFGWQRGLVILGGTMVGCGGLAGFFGGGPALLVGIATLGLGTGLSAAALQASVARDGLGAIVLLRTVERLGAVIGPLLAGSLLAMLAYGGVMVAIGSVMLAATLLFAAASANESKTS
jgi:predicted MFS family arabinose efflux permease